MFYGAGKNMFQKAHFLRSKITDAEMVLWSRLKNRNIFKVRFRRQHPVDIFVLDFYCHEIKLAIEVDGRIHLKREIQEYDEGRSHDIEKCGIKMLRFTNEQILNNLNEVQTTILNTINDLSPL